MAFWNKTRAGGFMDEIRCDEPSYLIWKWHPEGTALGQSNRENAIRWGSSLRVKAGEVAVFVYSQYGGGLDFIEGPRDLILETENLPVWASIVGLAYAGGTPFQAEVYFINLAKIIQVRFGVPFFDVFDPRYPDFSVPVAVRGTISFSITDCAEFIRLHRLTNFDLDQFQQQIRSAVNRYVKDAVTNAPATHNIPVVQLESKLSQINDVIEYDISGRLEEDFGVTISAVDIAAIELDKGSEGYRQLIGVTRDISGATMKAQADARMRDIAAKQRIESEHYEQTLRMQREEAQYAQRKATQSANFAAYQVESQTDVGVAGANALGQMGANGAGVVGFGGAGGFNMGAMMASMAVGGAVGQNIAGAMNNMMGGNQQPGMAPPPVPVEKYHVAANGQATGPFDIATLSQMANSGQLNANSLVWKQGMTEWVAAGTIDNLKPLFPPMPPIPGVN